MVSANNLHGCIVVQQRAGQESRLFQLVMFGPGLASVARAY